MKNSKYIANELILQHTGLLLLLPTSSLYDYFEKETNFLSRATWAHRAALISVSIALFQTPAYTATLQIRGPCDGYYKYPRQMQTHNLYKLSYINNINIKFYNSTVHTLNEVMHML